MRSLDHAACPLNPRNNGSLRFPNRSRTDMTDSNFNREVRFIFRKSSHKQQQVVSNSFPRMNINILNNHPPSPLGIFPTTNILDLQWLHLVLERVQGTSEKLVDWFDMPP